MKEAAIKGAERFLIVLVIGILLAVVLTSPSGPGIDSVRVYLDGPSGWKLSWETAGVAPGVHQLYLYAHRTTDNAWSLMDPHLVIVAGGPTRWLPVVLRCR